MCSFATPSAVALGHVGIPDARSVIETVNDDLAVVIVITAAFDPPVTFLCWLTRSQDGWRFSGLGGLGASWGAMSPSGDRGAFAYGVATSAEVTEVRLRIEQAEYLLSVSEGFGALIVSDIPPDPSWEVTSHRTVGANEIAGTPPAARTFSRHADGAKLAAIDDARHFVWAAQLQIERFVTAFHADARLPFVPATTEEQRRSSQAFAEAEFLLNAAAQARKALLRLGGPKLSAEMSKDIHELRNLHEHWEQQKASFAHPKLPKVRSGKDFAARHPTERPWEFKFATGDRGGHWISVLRVENLWDELESIDRQLSRLRNVEFDSTPTPHVVEDENRPLRRMPQPAGARVLAKSVLRQPITIGDL